MATKSPTTKMARRASGATLDDALYGRTPIIDENQPRSRREARRALKALERKMDKLDRRMAQLQLDAA